MTKAELRKLYLGQRASLSIKEKAEKSGSIADRFFEEIRSRLVRNLHCFISIEKFNEVDTSTIFEKIWNEFPSIRTSAPRLDREAGDLQHHNYALQTKLIENAWGIREPGE